jgi:hypothetical protein
MCTATGAKTVTKTTGQASLDPKTAREFKVFEKFRSYYPSFAGREITHSECLGPQNDPPDVLCTDIAGNRIGIELTEFMDGGYHKVAQDWKGFVSSSIELPEWDVTLRIQEYAFPQKAERTKIAAELKRIISQEVTDQPDKTSFMLERHNIHAVAPTLSRYCDLIHGYSSGTGHISTIPGLFGIPNARAVKIEECWKQLAPSDKLNGWDIEFIVPDCNITELNTDAEAIRGEIEKIITISIGRANPKEENREKSFLLGKGKIEELGASLLSKYCYGIRGTQSGVTNIRVHVPPIVGTPQLAAIHALEESIYKKVSNKNYPECIKAHQLKELYLLIYLDYNILKQATLVGVDMLSVTRTTLDESPIPVPFDKCFLYSVNHFLTKTLSKLITEFNEALDDPVIAEHVQKPILCDLAWTKESSP